MVENVWTRLFFNFFSFFFVVVAAVDVSELSNAYACLEHVQRCVEKSVRLKRSQTLLFCELPFCDYALSRWNGLTI